MPYEEITEGQYYDLIAKYPSQAITPEIIAKFENKYEEGDLGSDCEGGACPIR